jgi:hypothetical protein
MRGPLAEEMDAVMRWFSRVYPQWNLSIHYKWSREFQEHGYFLELNHRTKKTLPFSVPQAWFEDPDMEQRLRESCVPRLCQLTIQEVG